MSDNFTFPKRKLDRARKHITDFYKEYVNFFSSNPWSRVIDRHPKGDLLDHKIKFTQNFPNALTDTVLDAVNNLRPVLDQAAYASAVSSGITTPTSASFPFGSDQTTWENQVKGRCKHIHSDVIAIMRSFQPYKTGNGLLWALTEACNTDKHALLEPIAISVGPTVISGMTITGGPGLRVFRPKWNREKNEIVFAVTGPNVNADYHSQIGIDLGFGEIEIIQGKPVLPVLNAMANEVEKILNAIKSETRRLFPAAFL